MALNLGPLNVLLQLKGERKFNQGMSGASRNLLAMGAAGAAAALVVRKIASEVIEATQIFAEFERSMVRVGAVTNSLGSQAFAGLTERAQELATTTEFTARQVADAMGFMGMAGMSTNKIFESTPAVLQLASAGMVDVATAADTVTNIMAGYGVQAEDLEKTNNILVATFTNSNTSLQSLGQSFKYVGPVAKSAGIEFREAAAVIGLMGNAGIQADMAGTALRGTLIKLLDPTAEGAKIMRQYGINVVDATGKLKPMVEIFRQLEPIADDSAKMIELFGLRAGPGMQAAVSQGTEALERLIGKIDGAGNIAERIAKAQLDTLDGKIKIMKSNFEGLQIAIGEAFAPVATAAVELVSGYLSDAAIAARDLKAAIDGTAGSITEFGSEANIAMRNYIRAVGAVLGIDFGAVEPVIGSPKNVEAISVELEKQKALQDKLTTLGQKNAFEVKQYGVASSAVTEEIERTVEALTLSQERVKALGAEMRRASVPAKQLAKATVYPDLAQNPAFARRAKKPGPMLSEKEMFERDRKAYLFKTDFDEATQDGGRGLVDALAEIGYAGAIAVKSSVAATFTPRMVGDVLSPLMESTNDVVDAQAEQAEAQAKFAHMLTNKIVPGVVGAIKAISSGNVGQQLGTELGAMAGAAIGNLILPGVGGAAGSGIGSAIGSIMGSAFDELIAALGVLTPIFDLIGDLIKTMEPALIVLREMLAAVADMLFITFGPPLEMMYKMFSKALYPVLIILEALSPVLGLFGMVFNFLLMSLMPVIDLLVSGLQFLAEHVLIPVATVFLQAYNAVVGFINGITYFIRSIEIMGEKPFETFGVTLDTVSTNVRTYLEVVNEETDARAEATEGLREFSEELSNVPIGVKRLRAIQYGATRGATPFPSLFSQPAFGA